jgi:hypothetical protein
VGTIDNDLPPRLTEDYDSATLVLEDKIDVVHFTTLLVHKCLCKLKNKNTIAPDGLANVIFKKLSHVICTPLAILFNRIMHLGSVPDGWREAIVVPIFKSGMSAKVENYRPISLTSIGSKFFEAGIKHHLLEFLFANKHLSSSQHGFLPNKSTCSNLIESLHDWTAGLDVNKETLVVNVDFAKAFDKLSIPKLLFKLENLGITGTLLLCIKSFLTSRSQRVKIGSTMSSSIKLASGVPQGSVLGPILFAVFINDITAVIPQGATSKLFADDLKAYVTIDTESDVDIFRCLLDAIACWSVRWQLPLSLHKCNWLKITNKRKYISAVETPFLLNGSPLSQVSEIKDLGILINSHLNFSNHISSIITRAKQRTFLLNKSFVSKNVDLLVQGYKTYVLPLLTYCCQVWSPQGATDIRRLESVQRVFTKRLYGLQNLSYSDRLKRTGLKTLEHGRLVADLTPCYKILNNLIILDIQCFIVNTDDRTRGHSLKLRVNKTRTNSRLYFFANRVIKCWNRLSDDTVTACSV